MNKAGQMIKKTIKIFLKGLIILLTSILVVLLVARKIFPPEKLKMLAISKIETAINREISIGDVWLNPFKGISAKDIVVYERTTNNNRINDPPWFFKVDKVILKYNFFLLLKKEIRVSKVIVENPAVNLLQDEFQHWNFDDLISPAQVDSTKSDTAATEFILPLTLDLKELIVKNLTANIKMNQQDIAVSLKSAGITVTVNELKLPRNSYEKIKTESKAHLKILSLDEPWSFSLQFDNLPGKIEMNARVQTNFDFQFAGFSNLAGNGVLALADVNLVHYMNRTDDPIDKKFPLHQLCSFSFDFFGNINEELIKLKHFVATIGNEKIFDISGEMNQILSDPSVDLQIVDSKIGLNSLLNSFVPLLPDTLQSQFEKLTVDGIASLTGTKISGWPLSDSLKKSLLFELNFNIQNMSAFYTEPASKLSNVNLEIKSSAIYNLKGVQKVDLGMKMLIQSLAATLDTTKFVFEDLSAELSTTINDKFIPDSLSTSIKIKNFFHVPLNFSFDFKPEQGLKKYDARANLSFFELSLAEVTNSAAEGDIDFSLDVHSRKLSRIDAQVNISTDIIEVAAEDDPIIIYPMDILSIAVLSVDSSMKSIKLDSLRMKFDNFASLFVHGDFLIDPVKKLTASVDSFTIDHKKFLESIPEQFLEGFENLTVYGR